MVPLLMALAVAPSWLLVDIDMTLEVVGAFSNKCSGSKVDNSNWVGWLVGGEVVEEE